MSHCSKIPVSLPKHFHSCVTHFTAWKISLRKRFNGRAKQKAGMTIHKFKRFRFSFLFLFAFNCFLVPKYSQFLYTTDKSSYIVITAHINVKINIDFNTAIRHNRKITDLRRIRQGWHSENDNLSTT